MDEDEKEIAENDAKKAKYIHNYLASHLPETASTRETSHEVNYSDNASHKLMFDLLFPGIITNAKMWNIFEDELQENLNAAKTDQNTTSQEVQRSFIVQLYVYDEYIDDLKVKIWVNTWKIAEDIQTIQSGKGSTIQQNVSFSLRNDVLTLSEEECPIKPANTDTGGK
ncbi:hypothetical protein AAWM_07399 [Aspergillus awamori]|uniref:Uncharacterized protein n=1 Tax=Aspergillus awamori TaxID=105351 RepID=A0A401KZ33_ASPAW|nr:hypothetical protein AAWM_07399 [Aspergillus awamori]GKZ59866.1 hypothetical protein AnigIFM49718_006185 [Aspergillus niger]GLA40492.1 hypothetical protein AnigIFM63309_008326 [Aspergillus niger]